MAIDWNDPNLEMKNGTKARRVAVLKRNDWKYRNLVVYAGNDGNEYAKLFDDDGGTPTGVHPSMALHNPPKEEWVNVWQGEEKCLYCSYVAYPTEGSAKLASCQVPGFYIATVRIR